MATIIDGKAVAARIREEVAREVTRFTAERGARLRLGARGLRQTFEVRSRRLVPQGNLADDSWIFAASGDLRLTLVTCAPPYDRSRGGYQNLAVITALPLGPPEAP